MTGEEFNTALRRALRRHILSTSSISKAARTLQVARGTLHHFLADESDTGLQKALAWAEKLGLSPNEWIQESGLFPDHRAYSGLLQTVLDLGKPNDPLIKRCVTLAAKLPRAFPEQLVLPPIVLQLDNIFLADPQAAEARATKCMKNKIRHLQQDLRGQQTIPPSELAEFFALVASYGICRHSKTSPQDWAHCLALSLSYFQRAEETPQLTWLLIDASMVLRRHLKVEESLALARRATGSAVGQEPSRLYPRALLNLASVLFSKGQEESAEAVYALVVDTSLLNPYQALATFGRATSLARVKPLEAAEILHDGRLILDGLPNHRQLQRHWTAARVWAEIGRKEQAFASYIEAIRADEHRCDARNLFLLFEEARLLIGTNDVRLIPIAALLHRHLHRLSHMPEAFMIAKGYLDYLACHDEFRMKAQMEHLMRTSE